MAKADEFRASAVLFESWARSSATKLERKDFLAIARTLRQAAAELDLRAATVRQLRSPDQRKRPQNRRT
jgi:hypothetical protein